MKAETMVKDKEYVIQNGVIASMLSELEKHFENNQPVRIAKEMDAILEYLRADPEAKQDVVDQGVGLIFHIVKSQLREGKTLHAYEYMHAIDQRDHKAGIIDIIAKALGKTRN